MAMLSSVLLALLPAAATAGFYALPGVTPESFEEGDHVELKVARLDSVVTQLPYPYYTLPFCAPKSREFSEQHLGASLRGDRIETSNYKLKFETDEACRILCRKRFSKKQLGRFEEMIRESYRAYWLVDNLPAATKVKGAEPETYSYQRGFDIGLTEEAMGQGAVYLNNHVRLTIKYHKQPDKAGARIVAFEVEPFSVAHRYKHDSHDGRTPDTGNNYLSTCNPLNPINHGMPPMRIDGIDDTELIFTYDVNWVESDTRWASRWDMYLLVSDEMVHWFSVFNSLVTVAFLSGMVGIILIRTLNADIDSYNELDAESGREDVGWKLLHADVFRAPPHVNLLSALIGTGCQLFCTGGSMLVFSCLGLVSPAHRGGLTTAMYFTFVLMGTLSGYFSARNYKMLGGENWQLNTLWTAFLCPSIVFGVFFLLNLVLWAEGSSGAVPFMALIKMLFMFFGVHVPLSYAGGYFGFKRAKIEHPCRVNTLRRIIPDKEWYLHPVVTMLCGGMLPFGAIYVEINFVLSSIWLRHYYYVFGFMLLVFMILAVTCSEMCIVLCYVNLCRGDYEWWWRSFLTSGSCALYVFIHSIFYYNTQLNITKTLSMFLYFGYSGVMAFVVFILTGTIGYQATLVFIRQIFAAVKLD
eukprot:TRINITY_DN11180_c0_g1_i5.p1 TRINITY_DN11180_c0_g1~~TRINITY_DN11180_c0_g1_i5.p1  ORF type:complete len:638 (-),score=169.64 TRINITY_DN11180_c0_g1_i5:160-2073(-)